MVSYICSLPSIFSLDFVESCALKIPGHIRSSTILIQFISPLVPRTPDPNLFCKISFFLPTSFAAIRFVVCGLVVGIFMGL